MLQVLSQNQVCFAIQRPKEKSFKSVTLALVLKHVLQNTMKVSKIFILPSSIITYSSYSYSLLKNVVIFSNSFNPFTL